MKKKYARRLAAVMSVVLTMTNVTPAFAALTEEVQENYENFYDDVIMGKYKAIHLDDIVPTESTIIGGDKATSSNSDKATSSVADREDDLIEEDEARIASASMAMLKAGTVQITAVDDLKPYFPDENFRLAVFEAVKDGQDGAEGTDVEEALYNFRGTVKYDRLRKPVDTKIKDIDGIQYLRNAELVSLKYNEIRDFTGLEKTDEAGKRHYGELLAADPDIEIDAKNVVWDVAGNPIEKLPSSFGGRLEILQPASSSYTYPEDLSKNFTYMRPADGTSIGGTVDIAKTKSYDVKGENSVPLENCIPYYGVPGDTDVGLKVTQFTNNTATFTGPIKSGTAHLSVGTKEVLLYWTQDEYGNITDGKQSHKYYLTYTFRVYDKITAASGFGSTVQLTKKDKDTGALLAGAEYGVYKKDDTYIASLTTEADGTLKMEGLETGEYYFRELTPPAGYQTNPEKVFFTVANQSTGTPPTTSVGGGETTITTADGSTITAGSGDVLFSGGKDGSGNLLSPELTVSSGDPATLLRVEVVYSKLYSEDEGTTRTFANVADAQADINREKSNNNIAGTVSVKGIYEDNNQQDWIKLETTDTAKPAPQGTQINIAMNKLWSDDEGYHGVHPEITIYLLQNGKRIDSKTFVKAAQGSDYSYNFGTYDEKAPDGSLYVYTFEEEFTNKKKGEEFQFSFRYANGLYNLKNDHKNTRIKIEGEKTWDDKGVNRTHPDITVELWSSTDGAEFIKETEIVLPSGESHYVFDNNGTNWPISDPEGKTVRYEVREKALARYTCQQVGEYDLLNTYVPGSSSGGGDDGGSHSPGNNNPPSPGGPGETVPADPGTTPSSPEEPKTAAKETSDEGGRPEGLPKTGDSRSFVSLFVLAGSVTAVILMRPKRKQRANHK